MNDKFLKPYDPAATESRIYALWEDSGYFNPDVLPKPLTDQTPGPGGTPYTIMMPPPNATGVLHMGHALGLTIQDIVIRFKRMQGYAALWVPGTDHAAIATQSKVEKEIQKKEGKSRHDLGRSEMLARIHDYVEESRGTIRSQIRALGASCDWSREAFTLDDKRNQAVNELFRRMYEAGLIYRGNRIVNWDPKGQTTISDDEIVYEERTATLTTFRYAKDFPIPISTTRLETKVGDTAVAVHPDDSRYAAFVGQEYDVVFCDVPLHIKIVADQSVDPAFGTGALGVTPAHSQVDWEIADRHGLPRAQVINEYAKMTAPGQLHGLKVADARQAVHDWLSEEGLIEKDETIPQNVSTAERTGGIIEPLPKLQWFVDVDKQFILPSSQIPGIASGQTTSLKAIMRAGVENGAIRILPPHMEKTYFHWIDNLRPWCISRQIWYGHQVPVWYRGDEIAVGTPPEGAGWTQDEDTLDTWFSSGSWTFSTLGWPQATKDLARFHPTDFLETGYDILFFWIARMILMTGFALGQIPFRTVYLHGIVRDAQGRKFSKSLGNGIDPMDVTRKFGADAARMALIVGNTPGTDTRLDENKIKGYKNFANKLWNISRFVLEHTEDLDRHAPLVQEDQSLLEECKTLLTDITRDMEEYRMYLAAEKIYHYAWHRLADEILEESKIVFTGGDEPLIASRRRTLRSLLEEVLKALHPFMPFVTEDIWQSLPDSHGMLLVSPWPSS